MVGIIFINMILIIVVQYNKTVYGHNQRPVGSGNVFVNEPGM